MPGGRRRTDPPGELWGGTAESLIEYPATPGRTGDGSGRLPLLDGAAEAPHPIPRSRLPLPPVPAGPGGPRTSAAPFPAVPTPELPGGPAGDGPARPVDHAARIAGRAGIPVLPRPARTWPDEEPQLVSTGPGLTAAGTRASGPAPRLPRPATPSAGAPSRAYDDWTKPSHPSGPIDIDFSADSSGQVGLRLPAAPATSAIPERSLDRRGRARDGERFDSAGFGRLDSTEYAGTGYDSTGYDSSGYDSAGYDSAEFDSAAYDSRELGQAHGDSAEFGAPYSEELAARGPRTGPGTGTVGGRAASRAERQAIDEARRKAAKRNGEAVGIPDDEDGPARRPRRVLVGLVAMAVVALGVLGVYTVLSPPTQEAASGGAVTPSSAPAAATSTAVLPPLEDVELEVEVAPPGPVLAPVTVLNATDINGLAAQVAGVIAGGGWETPGVGTYLADDIAVPTVYYTEGDENQRQAAESLKAQFPQIQAVGVRFFEVPADVAAPGIVVVLTGQW